MRRDKTPLTFSRLSALSSNVPTTVSRIKDRGPPWPESRHLSRRVNFRRWSSLPGPLDAEGQFCDRGKQYRAAILHVDAEQQRLAEHSKTSLDASGIPPRPIVTEIPAATLFYPAEKYQQDYHRNNPARYKFYKSNCGRTQRLDQIWGKALKLPFENGSAH